MDRDSVLDRASPPVPAITHGILGGGGVKLHAREWGNPEGAALLFIHGWSQSDLCWLNQVRGDLAGTFRIVTFDLRGHGLSEKPAGPEHYADGQPWADDMAAALAWNMVVPPAVRGALLSRELDASGILASVAVPVLVTHGQQDAIVLPSMAKHTLTVCPAVQPQPRPGTTVLVTCRSGRRRTASPANSPGWHAARAHDYPSDPGPAVRPPMPGSRPRQPPEVPPGKDQPAIAHVRSQPCPQTPGRPARRQIDPISAPVLMSTRGVVAADLRYGGYARGP